MNRPAPRESQSFPKSKRLRKRAEFQRVYDEGSRLTSPYFSAFYRASGTNEPARVGLTVVRRIGGAAVRSRVKRRLREAFRLHGGGLPAGCEIVLHARGPIVGAEWGKLEAEIQRVFRNAAQASEPG